MQLLKQIWNERRSNAWLWLELLIVFVVLWYVIDWMYITARTYYEPVGFDITGTYYLELSQKNETGASYIPKDRKKTTLGEDIVELMNRLRRLPEVEAVSASRNSRPYIGSNSMGYIRIDTVERFVLQRLVTPEFFQVFRYQSADGGDYHELMKALQDGDKVIGENFWPASYRGDRTLKGNNFMYTDDSIHSYKIGAVSAKIRYNDFWANAGDRYLAYPVTEADLAQLDADLYPREWEVCLRVKPGTASTFAKDLMKRSERDLSVGNLFILGVRDYADVRKNFQQRSYNRVSIRFWFVSFLLANIFLGVVGTFWIRTQQRRSELGLRIAVGSNRRQIWSRLNREGIALLTMAAVPAAVICYILVHLDFTEKAMDAEFLRFFAGVGATYLLMLLMIVAGILYPARQAVRIQPAEALHEE